MAQPENDTVTAELLSEASQHALVAIRNILLRVAHAQDEKPGCPDWALREMLAIADTAHNLPEFILSPENFSQFPLASCAKAYRNRYGAGLSPAIGYTHLFWNDVHRLVGKDLSAWISLSDEEMQ